MCLILLAWQAHPHYPLVVAANRDEFFERPTASAQFWPEQPNLLAGRDLLAGGTWLGVTRNGRFAALTNYREVVETSVQSSGSSSETATPSRGHLVSDFLQDDTSASAYLNHLATQAGHYPPFNLICGDLNQSEGLWYYSNRNQHQAHSAQALPALSAMSAQPVSPGIHGLSNHLLDTPWPKVLQGKAALQQALDTLPQKPPLFALLRDEHVHADELLPRTGVSLEWERTLSAAFIRAPHYGTRSSTVLICDQQQNISFEEQSYTLDGASAAILERKHFEFKLQQA